MSGWEDRIAVWADACGLVADALDGGVDFEYPGTIDVRVTPSLLLVYGRANETINANVCTLVDGTWQPLEVLPDLLITDVPSDETDPERIAAAIVASVKQFSLER